VDAFTKTNKKLIIIGDGPHFIKIRIGYIILKGDVRKNEIIELHRQVRAFLFAAAELQLRHKPLVALV
jgi:hypothetical protein